MSPPYRVIEIYELSKDLFAPQPFRPRFGEDFCLQLAPKCATPLVLKVYAMLRPFPANAVVASEAEPTL
jgi:hypothetical protein